MNSYEQLRSLKTQLKEKFGDSIFRLDRLSALTLSDDLLHQIDECIHSKEDIHIMEGLNFFKGVMVDKDFLSLPEWFVSKFIARIRFLIDNKSKSVVYAALDWFVALRSHYSDYREVMLAFLKSSVAGQRELALKHYESFAREKEFEPLMSFETDDFSCQIGHAGNWEYELRDKALLLAEKYSGVAVGKRKLSEPYEGARVSWLDWSDFKSKI